MPTYVWRTQTAQGPIGVIEPAAGRHCVMHRVLGAWPLRDGRWHGRVNVGCVLRADGGGWGPVGHGDGDRGTANKIFIFKKHSTQQKIFLQIAKAPRVN
jgi:hypothetical protein